MKLFFKQLFCWHKYENTGSKQTGIAAGEVYYECPKCDKRKTEQIDFYRW